MAGFIFQKLFHKPSLGSLDHQVEPVPSSSISYQPEWTPLDITARVSVRVLLFRECTGGTRKLYFDSDTVIRVKEKDKMDNYDLIQDGWAYQYGKSSADVKDLGEMIYSSIAPSGKSVGFKVHFFNDPDKSMWSTTFSPEYCDMENRRRREFRSFGSSVGSNISSVSREQSQGSIPFLMDLDLNTDYDSGVYSVSSCGTAGGGGAHHLHVQSLILEESQSSLMSNSNNQFVISKDNQKVLYGDSKNEENLKIRLRSNSELPRSKNHQQNQKTIKSQQQTQQVNQNITPKKFQGSEPIFRQESLAAGVDHLSVNYNDLKKKKQINVLGLALIITTSPGCSHLLLDGNEFVQNVLSMLRQSCLEACSNSRTLFVHLIYEAWRNSSSNLHNFFRSERLSKTSWWQEISFRENYLETNKRQGNEKVARYFLQELEFFVKHYDTKENGFFFSTILTAVLSHHLGWVQINESIKENSDSSSIGTAKVAKTLVLSKDVNLSKRLMFVLTFFLRPDSSFSLPNRRLKFEENGQQKKVLKKQKVQVENHISKVVKSEKDSFVSSNAQNNNKTPSKDSSASPESDVVFMVGGKSFEDNNKKKEKCRNSSSSTENQNNSLFDIELVMEHSSSESLESSPQPLLFCGVSPETDSLMPGSILQTVVHDEKNSGNNSRLKQNVCLDLKASVDLNCMGKKLKEISCILGYLDSGKVDVITNYKELSATFETQLFPSALVINFVESLEKLFLLEDPLMILYFMEQNLNQISQKSRILSNYLLLQEMPTIEDIYSDLGFDPNDVSMLLSVASVHSEEISSKFGIGFK